MAAMRTGRGLAFDVGLSQGGRGLGVLARRSMPGMIMARSAWPLRQNWRCGRCPAVASVRGGGVVGLGRFGGQRLWFGRHMGFGRRRLGVRPNCAGVATCTRPPAHRRHRLPFAGVLGQGFAGAMKAASLDRRLNRGESDLGGIVGHCCQPGDRADRNARDPSQAAQLALNPVRPKNREKVSNFKRAGGHSVCIQSVDLSITSRCRLWLGTKVTPRWRNPGDLVAPTGGLDAADGRRGSGPAP